MPYDQPFVIQSKESVDRFRRLHSWAGTSNQLQRVLALLNESVLGRRDKLIESMAAEDLRLAKLGYDDPYSDRIRARYRLSTTLVTRERLTGDVTAKTGTLDDLFSELSGRETVAAIVDFSLDTGLGPELDSGSGGLSLIRDTKKRWKVR